MVGKKRKMSDLGVRFLKVNEGRFVSVPKDRTIMFLEIVGAYNEAKQLTDKYLYEDRLGWLKDRFEEDQLEYSDDYDWNTNVWSIGLLIAQIERYGGIVLDTDKGTFPITNVPENTHRITEKE